MFAWGSKFMFAVGAASWFGSIVYGLITGGQIVGTLSAGYKGGVGDHFGYTLFLSLAIVSIVAGVISVATRDGDAEELSSMANSDITLTAAPPGGTNVWGPLTAFGVGCIIIGVAISGAFLYLGIAVLAVVGIQWLALAWSDGTSSDPELNEAVRSRILGPLEIPLLSMLAIGVVVVAISRMLLAVSQVGSTVVASLAAVFVFGSANLIVKSKAPKQIITAIVTTGAVLLLVGGLVSAAAGERDFHHGAEGDDSHSSGESQSSEGTETEGDNHSDGSDVVDTADSDTEGES